MAYFVNCRGIVLIFESVGRMAVSTAPVRSSEDKKVTRDQRLTDLLEEYTVAYMRGDLELKDYRKKLQEIGTRLDLRRVASKLPATR